MSAIVSTRDVSSRLGKGGTLPFGTLGRLGRRRHLVHTTRLTATTRLLGSHPPVGANDITHILMTLSRQMSALLLLQHPWSQGPEVLRLWPEYRNQ